MSDHPYDSPRADLLGFVPPGARTVLDVGCSSGGFGATVRAARPDVELSGIEPHPSAAERARAHYAQVVTGDFPDDVGQLRRATFDAVFFNDVLEHLLDPAAALRAALPLVADGGAVIASIPNVRHFSVLWDLVRHDQWHYTETGILDRTHLRFFTATTMRELFTDTGWRIRHVTGHNRARWPQSGQDTWKTRALAAVTRGRSDPFFWTQYVIEAVPA